MQGNDTRHHLDGSSKIDEPTITECPIEKVQCNLRQLNHNPIAQQYSNSSISIIQTVSESDDMALANGKMLSINNANVQLPSSPLKLSSELTGGRVAWLTTSNTPSVIETTHTIASMPQIETTPQSGFTAISNCSINPYGTRIGKNHSSFLLMYYMLTGIRSSVKKLEEIQQQPIPVTYEQIDKKEFKNSIKFPLNQGLVFTKCCFSSNTRKGLFKDYAPVAFKFLRKCFFIDNCDYLSSLTGRYVLSELGSPGRSGSFFYYSHDYRFLIKTIGKAEHTCLLSILPDYCSHVERYPNTLLTRFLGLHRVNGFRSGKSPIYFVVMGNVFPPSKDIHEIYDLKGSFHGRQVPIRKLTRCPREPRKDLNWLRAGKKLLLSSRKASLVQKQLERDVNFLSSHNIMDYSLLVGIHSIQRGNKEKIRDKALSVFETTTIENDERTQNIHRHHQRRKSRRSSIKSAIVGFARPLTQGDPISLLEQSEMGDDFATHPQQSSYSSFPTGPSMLCVGNHHPIERLSFLFYSEEGGILSGNEETDHQSSSAVERPTEIYYLGIIDILTPYSPKKQLEHFIKSCCSSELSISSVSPSTYSKRFLAFTRRCVLNQDSSTPSSRMSKRIDKYLTSMVAQSEYELSLATSMVNNCTISNTNNNLNQSSNMTQREVSAIN